MTDEIKSPLFGPVKRPAYDIEVEGRLIPHLKGDKDGELSTVFFLDERFSITVPNEMAVEVAWFVATALAIGAGYSSINAEEKGRRFAPALKRLG